MEAQSRATTAMGAAPALACFALGWLGYQLAKQTWGRPKRKKRGKTDTDSASTDQRAHNVAYSDLHRACPGPLNAPDQPSGG